MNIGQVETAVGRAGTGPVQALRAQCVANTPTKRSATADRGRRRTPAYCIAAGVAFLAVMGCSSQPAQIDSAATARSVQSQSKAAKSPAAPVTQTQPTPEEIAALSAALQAESRAESASLAASAGGMPAQGSTQLEATVEKARKLGFRIVDRDGETVYCHTTTATGSHLTKRTICLTEEQWQDVSTNSARGMERQQRISNPCPNGGSCGG